MGSFADAALTHMSRSGGCAVCKMLADLPKKDQAEVAEAMAMPSKALSSVAIRSEMIKRGWNPPNIDSLRDHRRGVCTGLPS